MRLIVVFFIIILGFSFEKPVSKHCNPKYISPHEVIVANLLKGDRTIKIFLDDSFEERDRLIFIDTLKGFNAFGLKVFLVSSKEDRNPRRFYGFVLGGKDTPFVRGLYL